MWLFLIQCPNTIKCQKDVNGLFLFPFLNEFQDSIRASLLKYEVLQRIAIPSSQKDFNSLRIQIFHGRVNPILGLFTISDGSICENVSVRNCLGVCGNFNSSGIRMAQFTTL